MVDCECCGEVLDAEHLSELEDKDKKMHLVCTDCKKKADEVLETFDEIDWDAFVLFVKRYEEGQKEYMIDPADEAETAPPPSEPSTKKENKEY